MKGRRRARRMALEALYELDQSTHSLDTVVLHRAQAMVEEALSTLGARIPLALRAALIAPAARAFLGETPDDQGAPTAWPDAPSADAIAALSASTGAPAAAVTEAYAKATALRTQVAYGAKIVYGVAASLPAIDRVIAEIAPEWPVPQMAPVDRNVLRIALWEIGSGSAPLRVVINEAVELAREYVGESTRRMVNGALGTYAARSHPLDLAAER